MSNNKLPPLGDEAFDGARFTKEIKNENRCNHKGNVRFAGNSEIKCQRCGNAWAGVGIEKLLALFNA